MGDAGSEIGNAGGFAAPASALPEMRPPSRARSRTGAEGTRNTLFAATVVDDGDEIIGFGRGVGDDGVAFRIVHVVVMAARQGQGIGSTIVDGLMQWP